jgi:hypothetical protein
MLVVILGILLVVVVIVAAAMSLFLRRPGHEGTDPEPGASA